MERKTIEKIEETKEHTLVIEGRNAVLEAFRSGRTIDKLFVLDGCQDGPVRTIVREAKKHGTILNFVGKERLSQLTQTGRHQGVIAYAAAYDYDKIQNISETGDREALFLEVSKAAGRLLDSGVSEVIVTGVLFEEQDAAKECTVGKETGTGGRKVANLTVTREKTTAGISSFIGASYSGTGDLFASVIAGGKARGDRTEDSVRLAGEMIEKAVRESAALGISGKEGAEYEKYLWMLCKKTKESGEKKGK